MSNTPVSFLKKKGVILYITTPKRKGGSTVVRLVHGYRKDGKVKIKTIKTLGQSKIPEEIEHFKKMALNLKLELEGGKKQKLSSSMTPLNLCHMIGESSRSDGIEDILGSIYEGLGFEELISDTRKDKNWNTILKYCVLARFLEPSSKLRAVELILNHFHYKFSYDQILRMMDHISKSEVQIKAKLSERMLEKSCWGEVLLFDVTTLYFENVTETDLKAFGYSKDSKFKEVQVVLALITDSQGLPINYEIFPGNTAESKTFISCLKDVQRRHGLKRMRVTADKAMFSRKNFAFFQSDSSLEYVISCPLRKLPRAMKEEVLDLKNYKRLNKDKSFFKMSYEGKDIFVIRSQSRASHDRQRREKVLEMIQKAQDAKGDIEAQKLMKNRGMTRFLKKVKGSTQLNEQKVFEDEKWDGIAGLCTNIKGFTAHQTEVVYKKLWRIEESFRINKHTLKMRPIFHQLSKRIKAHILICFLAYIVLRYTEVLLKSKNIDCGVERLIKTLCDVEKWTVKDIKTKEKYVISKKTSKTAQNIYKALGLQRKEVAYQLKPKTI